MKKERTFLRRSRHTNKSLLPQSHGGVGEVIWTEVVGNKERKGRGKLNFFHDNIMRPGVSVGLHKHTTDEEYYYIISGNGVLTLDDQEYDVGAGDLAIVYPGGSHGLRNPAGEDLRFIVISVS